MTQLCKTCVFDEESNELEILVRQLNREVTSLMKHTDAKFLLQDGKIAELCLFIKDNLSNSIRELIDTMTVTGEIDNIIREVIDNDVHVVYPSNDVSGYLDVENIQAALDSFTTVQLVAGDYYIGKSIVMKTGNKLTGAGVNTILNNVGKESVIKGHKDGFDHIGLKDIQILNGKLTNEISDVIAVDLTGNDNEPYNGARYSYFSGVRISGFATGVQIKGLWSTVFERVRTISCTTGLKGLGCINNVTIDQCEFTHGETGILLTCDGSTENYGIRINNCNFEGNSKVCIDGTGCIKLSVHDMYSEKTPKLFAVNSCPQFTVDGGHVSGVSETNTILSTAYPGVVFKNPKATVKNLNIVCTLNDAKTLLYIDGGISNCEVHGNTITNKGTGNVTLLSTFNGVVHKKCQHYTENQIIRYSMDYKKYIHPDIATDEIWRPSKLQLTVTEDCVTQTTTRYTIRLVYADGTYEDIGYTSYLNAGSHAEGETLGSSLSKRPELKEGVTVWLIPSADPGENISFNVFFDYIVWNAGY